MYFAAENQILYHLSMPGNHLLSLPLQTIGNENEDMIEALQTRRKQRQDEVCEPINLPL